MKIIAIDSSGKKLCVCTYRDGEIKKYVSEPDPKSHNKILLDIIEKNIVEQGEKLADFDAFAVIVGPGSFTGIRIGVATINAFATALQKPVVEVTSLEQVCIGGNVLALLDCKHNNFYACSFVDGKKEYSFMTKEETENSPLPKIYVDDVMPEALLSVAVEKFQRKEFVKRARPFYIKSSSAETGIN